MNIYIIERPTQLIAFGENAGYVIVANNKDEVVNLAAEHSGFEDEGIWKDPFNIIVNELGEYTGDNKKPYIVLIDRRDF